MMIQNAQVQQSTKLWTPVFVQAEGRLGDLQIRSLTGDDPLCQKVIGFLENNDFEFYRHGKRFTHQEAVKAVDLLRGRFEKGVPFSGLAVLQNDQVVGFLRIGFDENPRKLQIAGMGLEKLQNQGNGQKVLEWVLSEYLPALHAKGYRLPVYASDATTVKEWVDLDKTSVVATVHPDYKLCNHVLEKIGFKLMKQITIDRFSGLHDGRRNVYEIALKRFMK